MMNSKYFGKIVRVSAALSAAGVVALTAAAAPAAISGAGFSVTLGSNARVLDAIGTDDYYAIWSQESCDNPHLRIRANNKPAIMLTVNDTLESGAELSSFTLTIENPDYFFGTGDGQPQDIFTEYIKESVYTDEGVEIVGNSLSDNLESLTVEFTGLTAGKKVIFNVDLDAVDDPNMFLYPDFRHVLHGAPLTSEDAPGDPATFMGVFTDGLETLNASGQLEQITDVPAYSNQNVRPYQAMDMIPVTSTDTDAVPEPATVSLAGLTLLAGYAMRRRRS